MSDQVKTKLSDWLKDGLKLLFNLLILAVIVVLLWGWLFPANPPPQAPSPKECRHLTDEVVRAACDPSWGFDPLEGPW